ncbi:segregation and condensation protein A [Aestuariimicrobium soli]|uniref:segregation and condensation protein A n=1 Tax=Aestuariimicrobium soli TaxID=2035834 RepID=UPI003EB76B5E
MSPAAAVGQPVADETLSTGGFTLHLDNFEGPFDLLLQLISKHKLDVTEVALSRVTDEFIAHVKAGGKGWDLEQTSSFLLVAATLLDLKAARLLPQGEVDDEEDLALLEARDLLFARLLQYRAFKIVSALFADRLGEQARRFARPGGLEPRFAALLPEVTLPSPERLAEAAARALTPVPAATVGLEHLHQNTVSVQEQAQLVVARLRAKRVLTFRELVADADRLTTVARFLSLLELFREHVIAFEQLTALGELTIRWTGDEESTLEISDEFDQPPATEETP